MSFYGEKNETDEQAIIDAIEDSGGGGTSDVNITQVGGVATSLGQKTMAASIPVVLPSDQTINLNVGDIEIGAVELKNATTDDRVAVINSAPTTEFGVVTRNIPSGTQAVSGTFFQATQPVSAASLPLPSGAATAALQTQPGVDIGDVTINNASGGSAVNIQDGGNSITVDGTFFQATQPVSIAGLPSMTNTQLDIGNSQVATPTSNLASRKTISIKALAANAQKVYVGLTGVSSSNGYELSAGDSIEIDCDATVNLFTIAASGTQRISIIEVA